jgi:hypothetical protein
MGNSAGPMTQPTYFTEGTPTAELRAMVGGAHASRRRSSLRKGQCESEQDAQ